MLGSGMMIPEQGIAEAAKMDSMATPGSWRAATGTNVLDWILLLGIAVYSAAGAWSALHANNMAAEDGAMLLRYSHHLAQGHGIRWNIGQAPVEGATDFLYMAAVAGVEKLTHHSTEVACRELLFVCWVLLGLTIFCAARFVQGANRWIALALACYACSAGEGLYLTSFFGAPFMMLAVACAWAVGTGLIAGRLQPTWGVSLLFSVLALGVGLTRPEGNILAVLMLASIVFLRGREKNFRLIVCFVAVFAVLGGAYFLWRYHYFGFPLPNPFYVKGKGHPHLGGLSQAAGNVFKIIWPTLPVIALGFRSRTQSRLLVGLAIPLLGYTCIWILLTNENNHLFRFQMPVLPVTLIFLPLILVPALEGCRGFFALQSRRVRWSFVLAASVYVVTSCVLFNRSFSGIRPSSAKEYALALSRYAPRGYTMAVTEAGQFPFFSDWSAIDALGLNDARIAHHGIDEGYLEQAQPELILYHLVPTYQRRASLSSDDLAEEVARLLHADSVLHSYALHHGYVLAAAYGSEPCNLNVFYVKPGTSDTAAIVDMIRSKPYYFLDSGLLSEDFRAGFRKECNFPAALSREQTP